MWKVILPLLSNPSFPLFIRVMAVGCIGVCHTVIVHVNVNWCIGRVVTNHNARLLRKQTKNVALPMQQQLLRVSNVTNKQTDCCFILLVSLPIILLPSSFRLSIIIRVSILLGVSFPSMPASLLLFQFILLLLFIGVIDL
jgi:hypothetical protein